MKNYKYKMALLSLGLAIIDVTHAEQTVDGANTFFSQIVEDGHAQMSVIANRIPTQRSYKHFKRGWFSNSVEHQGTDEVLTNAMWTNIKGTAIQKTSCLWEFLGGLKPTKSSWENNWRNSPTHYIYEYSYTRPEQLKLDIDWGKVKVTRSTHFWDKLVTTEWSDLDENKKRIPGVAKTTMSMGTSLLITPLNPKYGEVIQLRADDAMLDRIEYAAKFLQLSCDRTASTGF